MVLDLKVGREDARDPQRAYELAQEVMNDETFPEWGRNNAFTELVLLLSNGPEGIKSHQKAIELFESKLDFEYRTIEAVADIYQNGEYQDLSKAIKMCKQLSEGYQSYSPDDYYLQQQLKALQRILAIYKDNPTEPLDFETAADTAKMIEANPQATAAIKLEVQISLSAIHVAHPEIVPLEQRHVVHAALANNPMASPMDKGVALERLITVYTAQGKLPEVVETYEQRLVVAEHWQRIDILNNFITFLENPENVVVADPVRLQQLAQQLNDLQNVVPVVHHYGFFNQVDLQPLVQLPGLVPGFGGQGGIDVDPYFSPEVIANRKRSLRNLSKDVLDVLNYQEILNQTLDEIELTIAEYASIGSDYAETAEKAYEVFALGNSVVGSFDPILKDLDYEFIYGLDSNKRMTFAEVLVRIQNRINSHIEKDHLKQMFVVQLAAAIDPDGHIVCPIGKLARILQVLEGKYDDIQVVSIVSLENVASYYFKLNNAKYEVLPEDSPLKILEAKVLKANIDNIIPKVVDAKIFKSYPWVSQEKHQKVFSFLDAKGRKLLAECRLVMIEGLKDELLKSRDVILLEEEESIEKQVNDYICNTWLF